MSTIEIPFFNWPALFAEHKDEFVKLFEDVGSRGGFILHNEVKEFELNLAKFLGVKHVIGLADATNAMLLGLRASGLRAGAEVILPAHSFVAAAQSVHFAGGVNVPVELDTHDWLVDPDAIRRAITSNTQAIMPVHVNGRVCQMDAIMEIAHEHGLLVFEDSAQALGATFNGTPAGMFGEWGVFSFYPSKTLGTFGDAGALITNDDRIAEDVRRARNHGANEARVVEADYPVWGTNSRLDNIQAAFLNFKLAFYDDAIARRRAIAARYSEGLCDLPQLRLPPSPNADARYFDIYQNFEMCADDRDALRAHLADEGIGSIVQWGGLGLNQLTALGFTQKLPKTDRFFSESLLIPMNHLLTDAEVDRVIGSIRAFYRGRPVANGGRTESPDSLA